LPRQSNKETLVLNWLKSHITGGGLTAYITHGDCLQHNMGVGHPECPERLIAIRDQLMASQIFDSLQEVEAPQVSEQQLARVHPPHYVEYIEACAPSVGTFRVDPDTAMNPGTLPAAQRAAGAVVKAVDMVMGREAPNAFCAIRPPGHHAESDKAMGFCFFNNIAVGIAHALSQHRLERVAFIDFDVHHGNGTQAAFQDDDSLFLGSIHQMPLYPGTGAASETGVGNIVNAPVPPHAARESWRATFAGGLMPALDAFRPDLILISAGFDAHRRDPLAHQSLEAEDFAWATRAVLEVARRTCAGKVVSALEGGYDLEGLGRSAVAHVMALGED